MPGDLLGLIGVAHRRGGIPVTLRQLLAAIGAEDDTLAGVGRVVLDLQRAQLELVPGVETGDLDSERFLRPIVSHAEAEELLGAEIASGESASVEYKSSLVYDRARAVAVPGTAERELESNRVRDAALKAMCGFLNADGGVLILGITDERVLCGIDDDFRFTGAGADLVQCHDRWQLHLRDLVRGRFHDGARINGLVDVAVVRREDRSIARLRIGRARTLACVTVGGNAAIFVRRGNRTDRLNLHEIEDVVRERAALEDGAAWREASR